MKRLVVLLILVLGIPLAAMADQISLGDSCTGNGGLTIDVGAPPTVSGGGYTDCQATFESTSGNIGGLTYTLDDTTFTITDGGSNSLSATVTWLTGTQPSPPGGNVFMEGLLTVDSVSGFYDLYVQGGVYNFDVTLNGCGPTDSVWCGGVSSGQVPVPEPATLTLLGTGLLGLGGVIRRRLGGKK